MTRLSLGLVASFGVALVLAGCATSVSGGTSAFHSAEPEAESFYMFADGLLTYEQKVNADGTYISPLAQFTGTLSFENGCVLVGGEPHVFPADGTSWDGTILTVRGNEFVVGDELIGGGGGPTGGTNLPDEAVDSCGDSVAFIVTGVDSKR
jgi:hypothetical protein